jgi:hypothetical protein
LLLIGVTVLIGKKLSFVKLHVDRASLKLKIFKNNKPGDEWYTSFLSRHSDLLKPRLSENIKRSGAAVSRTTIIEYFNNL